MARPPGRRRRAIPDISSSDRLSERLVQLLHETGPNDRMYVYRMENGEPIKPALYACYTYPDLLDWLRDIHGGGTFWIIIKRGRTIIFSGAMAIWQPSKARHGP